jgi:hypothetical protein
MLGYKIRGGSSQDGDRRKNSQELRQMLVSFRNYVGLIQIGVISHNGTSGSQSAEIALLKDCEWYRLILAPICNWCSIDIRG